jgi:hypothetical protein
MSTPKNIAASVRQRLLNRSREDNRSFNELLQYYSMERFLYRLSVSEYESHYILKGALMLRAWNSPEFRPTMDIDMLGRTGNDEANVTAQIREVIAMEVEPDGLSFDADSIQSERITKDADYDGVRIRFRGALGTARINMQIDIGFGDVVYPGPERAELPCMLDAPAPSLLCYSRESAIAEKFEAMVSLGELNSRMKDFYDVWLLSRQFAFELEKLAEATKRTFKQRGTELAEPIDAFSQAFVTSRQPLWTAFRKRLKQEHLPESFAEITAEVEAFMSPVIKGEPTQASWPPAGPWSP